MFISKEAELVLEAAKAVSSCLLCIKTLVKNKKLAGPSSVQARVTVAYSTNQ